MGPKKVSLVVSGISILVVLVLLLGACSSTPSPTSKAPAPKPAPAPTTTAAPTSTTTPASTAAPKPASSVQPVVWKMSHGMPVAHPQTIMFAKFADLIKQKTAGRLTIDVHAAGDLGYKGDQVLRAVKDGLLEMASDYEPWVAGELPLWDYHTLAFLYGSWDEARKGNLVARPFLAKNIERFNAQIVYSYPFSAQHLFANFQAPAIDDWKGKKVRVYSADTDQVVRLAGGTPTTMPLGDVYMAMSRNTVDGMITGVLNIKSFKFYEVTKYVNKLGWFDCGHQVLVNRDKVSALPKDIQDIFLSTGKEFEEEFWKSMTTQEESWMAELPGLGMKIVDVPQPEIKKLADRCTVIWDDYTKRNGATGLELLNAVKKALGK